MMTLSYSTLFMLHTQSHNWINKMCGIEVPQRPEWENGKRLHRIIQDHVSGKLPVETLQHLNLSFPIVEEVDFDARCKFTFKVDDKYSMIGFVDGYDTERGLMLEIKTGNPMWSVTKFAKSMQRKIYAIGRPELKEAYLITAFNDETQWNVIQPKAFKIAQTDTDRAEAMQWIQDGIKILESGDYTGGLVEGKCVNFNCNYSYNCQFK